MQEFDYSILKNPEIFQQKRLSAHSDEIPYATAEEALAEGKSSFRISLDGWWKFRWAPNVAEAPKHFMDCSPSGETDPVKDWGEIRVPGHMEMQGYGHPQYVNTQYPWDGHEDLLPGEIPERYNPVGSYVKYFTLPAGFLKNGLVLRLEGSESGTAVWLNGHYAGYTEDSFTAHEFDLTPFLRDGENKLALQVFRFTSGSWCEDQDFFRFSGIFRSVFLVTKPCAHVADLRHVTELSPDFREGELRVSVKLEGEGTVRAVLLDGFGETPEEAEKAGRSFSLSAAGCGTEYTHTGAIRVSSPRLWSAEHPNLYRLLLLVHDGDGALTEAVASDAGFREFRMSPDHTMLLNGRRIVFCGVNRHEFSSRRGRALTEEEMRTDLFNMKRNNINALRMSHYPNQSAMYRLCDRLGLYVIDETNLETHGTWDAYTRGVRDGRFLLPKDHEEWRELVLDRASGMYERDKNHACILIWSCGNESFGGRNLYEITRYFHKKDPSRLVHYESICHDRSYPDTSDMESRMYPSVKEIRSWLSEHRDKPFVCCEYAHAMGNSCGAVEKYTELAWEDPLYQGGFIWDYIDQTITAKDRCGAEYEAYGGDFGERPTDWDFSANGIAFGGDERRPTPKMQAVRWHYRPFDIRVCPDERRVTVTNRMLFSDASEFDAFLEAEQCGSVLFRKKVNVQAAPGECRTWSFDDPTFAGEDAVPQLPASGETAVRLSLRQREACEYAPAGWETAFGEAVTGQYIPPCPAEGSGSFEICEGAWNWGVRGEHFEVLFSLLTGGMISYRLDGRELLEGAVRPSFWRAPTQNDIGNGMPQRCAQWKAASEYATTKREMTTDFDHLMPPLPPVTERRESSFCITFSHVLPTHPETEAQLKHEVFKDGTVKTTLSALLPEGLPPAPEFGVMLRINADLHCLKWYGCGPEETYADRLAGAKLGLYTGDALTQMAPYVYPQESGNHARTRWAAVTDETGRGLLFAACPDNGDLYAGREGERADGMSFSALPWTPSEVENAGHPYDLPAVHRTVVRVSAGQMGIGGDDTWGALTHPEYLLRNSGRLAFAFLMKGV